MSESDFADVMAALRDGQAFQVGGGRIFPTYAMRDGQVVVIVSDDGYRQERACSESELRAAIAEAPHCFREIIEWRTAQRREVPASPRDLAAHAGTPDLDRGRGGDAAAQRTRPAAVR